MERTIYRCICTVLYAIVLSGSVSGSEQTYTADNRLLQWLQRPL